ncbi:MAG: acyl transferase [Bacteroidota bacterium]|nr:acyl transferase [Bacteroidota bacterium]
MLESEFERYKRDIFSTQASFDKIAIELFYFQYTNNPVYKSFVDNLRIYPHTIKSLVEIPFLPIQFFKFHKIKTGQWDEEYFFLSSGTTNTERSKHHIKESAWYKQVSLQIFKEQVKPKDDVTILAYLPGYVENPNSSLINMIQFFQEELGNNKSESPFIKEPVELFNRLQKLNQASKETTLFGVSFALLDFAKEFSLDFERLRIIETGGMKNNHREVTREELITKLKSSFPKSSILSEYGMTELLSQAYAMDGENYSCPKSMKVIVTDPLDPFSILKPGQRGIINVIDLANIHTCAFIKTADVGIINNDDTFKVLGRFNDDDVRGCHQLFES